MYEGDSIQKWESDLSLLEEKMWSWAEIEIEGLLCDVTPCLDPIPLCKTSSPFGQPHSSWQGRYFLNGSNRLMPAFFLLCETLSEKREIKRIAEWSNYRKKQEDWSV